MNKLNTIVPVAALMAIVAPAAFAASILVDDFSVAQAVVDNPSFGGAPLGFNTSTVTIAGGVERTLTVATSPAGVDFGSTLTSSGGPNGELSFANMGTANGQFGIATAFYNYNPSSDGSFINLRGVDGNLDKFFFDVGFADLAGTQFTTTVESTSGSDDFVEFIELDGSFNPFTAFSNFIGVDFTEVTSLKFEFNTNPNAINPLGVQAFDGSVNSISVVPLPASALLLLGGLGGIAGVSAIGKRRRRRQSA